MMRSRRRFCTGAAPALFAVLSGCAAPQRQLVPENAAGYWSGRMSVQVFESPPQTTSGSFELAGTPVAGELILLNPLGNIVARVQWDAHRATITQGNETRQADSLDALVQELLGTPLPIAALFDWMNGKETQAQGWIADLSAHSEGKIFARRATPLPEASLRIVLDERR